MTGPAQPSVTASRSKHAPGWSWRKDFAGNIAQPWPSDHPAQVGGLCESGWHGDCPQAPLTAAVRSGQCACPCHAAAPGDAP